MLARPCARACGAQRLLPHLGARGLKYDSRLANKHFVDSEERPKCWVQQRGGERCTVTSRPVRAGQNLFMLYAPIRRRQSRYSLQVGREAHIVPFSDYPDPVWKFMNHSFEPTVRLSFLVGKMETTYGADPGSEGVLKATAIGDLAVGAEVTFDYTLWEWDMAEPFVDEPSGRTVRGFAGLTEEEQQAALPHAEPHIKGMHLMHLFGQSSRC